MFKPVRQQEAVGCNAQSNVMMKAAPTPSLVVAQTELLFEILDNRVSMRQRILAVFTDGVARWATDRPAPSRCRFFREAILEYLKSLDLPGIIVARLTAEVRKLLVHQIPTTSWRAVAREIDVADLEVSLPNWKTVKRRFVGLRQEIAQPPQASDRRICPGYTYRVMVTSVPYGAEIVTRMYAGRADSENRIKELKEDLSLDTSV